MAVTYDPETFNAIRSKLQEAVALQRQGQLAAADALYHDILELDPKQFDALQLLGAIALQRNNAEAAVDLISRALAVNPAHASAHFNLGKALAALGRHEAAVAAFDAALGLKLDIAEAHAERARGLYHLRRYEDAVAACDRAIALNAHVAVYHNDRAAALAALKYLPAAIASYDRAVALDPNYAEAYVNRGHALGDCGRFEEAAASYDAALRLKPDFAFLRGSRLQARMQACVWDNLECEIADIKARTLRDEKTISPWLSLILCDDPPVQRKAAEIWTRTFHPPLASDIPAYPRGDKIRIGYYSADFHGHATSYLMAGLFESHDRAAFEITAFSFGPETRDDTRQRVSAAFDHFVDVSARSDADVAAMSRERKIDIAVDLKGYTQDYRMGIFARRAAPIQASYIGYPGTLGADYIDYIIADGVVIPADARADYAEKVVALPGSYQVNDSRRVISDRVFSRVELGLPAHGFVFCCFNHSAKIQSATFDIWMRALRAVPGSVLWLLADYEPAAANLRKEAARRGIDGARLIFAGRMPLPDHLARLKTADLFIDTLPYNAHTTASDALWAGVPVVTQVGAAFAGRVAASLLEAVGMPELIVETAADYETLIVALATQPARLSGLRRKLAGNRLSAPLFDTARFARQIEDAYRRMLVRHQAGLPPDHIAL